MTRTVPPWVAKSDDQSIPDRVKLRLFLRADGKCAGCTRKLNSGDRWQADHIIALVNGGLHAETNLQVLCDWCHKKKTRQDVAEKAHVNKRRATHIGIKKRGRTIPGRRFNGEPIPSRERA